MKIYDELTHEEIQNPDLSLGYTYPGRRFVAHHDAVTEQYHYEIMSRTESMRDGKGLRTKVIDVPAREAWDEYEQCLYYHAYTKEELDAMQQPDDGGSNDVATWDELAEAYNEGVMQA